MSVVAIQVTKDKIIIGADSIVIRGWSQTKDPKAKLFKVKDMVFGTAGLLEEGTLFYQYCMGHTPKHATEEGVLDFFLGFKEQLVSKYKKDVVDNDYIFVYDNKAFLIQHFYIKEITDYETIGAGEDFARAALYLGCDVKDAIKTACELSTQCEEPISILEIPKIKKK